MRSARTRLTREQILALGPFKGAEGDAGSAGGSGEPAPESGGTGTGDSKSSGDKDGTGGSGKSSDDLDDVTDPDVLRRKARNEREASSRLHKKVEQTQRELDELREAQEAEKEKARRETQSEVDNLKDDVAKRDDTIAAQRETIRRLTVELAFAQVKDVDWYDPEDALRLVDLSDVEFDERTGNVKDKGSIVKAAKDLAKAKPHLVKSSTSVPASTPTGVRNGSAPQAGAAPGQADKEALIRKYRIHR
jgi:hypothetical protein